MQYECLPKSDLQRLKQEVLDQLPEAALPANLPDHWLDMIARDLEETVGTGGHGGDSSSYASAPLALIVHIMAAKTSSERLEISLETLHRYFCDLRIEVNLEIVNRRTEIKVESATLETIFSNRDVRILNRRR
ncbi:MAG: hypothetical protein WCT05_00050 [Lentisphaeria bacterium]